MARELPTGTVTFLFTDMEGSTRLLTDVGAERYAETLAEHRRILRESCTSHGGLQFGTEGDAFFAAFPAADAAVDAASDAQHALRRIPPKVRMAVHSGEPLTADDDYVGMDVHRAARICATAHGGQVVVSSRTRQLLERDHPLIDLGLHRLKDLREAERLFQLGDGSFPPLRSLNATNLPAQPGELVGRERELAELVPLVAEARLVTLTGAGGSGKTRLALQVAAELVPAFPDGVFWAPLAAVTEPELVLSAIGSHLGVQGELAQHIDERHTLLLLDNLEQVIAAAPQLSQLLQRCPNLHLLVTSRTLLRIEGEREYAVQPLAERDALSLFRLRAAVAEPEEAVLEICRRVDCLPLAVELAAARTKLLPPPALLTRLHERLPLLTAGRRDAPDRQRTLRATIEWSYALLSTGEQAAFRRLAVFAGSFDPPAAEAVAGVDLDTLQSLVEKSLVRAWASGRLGLLETVREFALGELESEGAIDALRRRHAERYLALAQSANLADDADRPQRHELLEHEDANLSAALEWTLAAGETELGVRLAASLEHWWIARNPFEGARWLRLLLERREELSPALLARGLRVWAECIFIVGDFDEGARLFQEALGLCRQLGDERGVGLLLQRLAIWERGRGDIPGARSLAEKSLAVLQHSGSRSGELQALGTLGDIKFAAGEHDAGLRLIEESVALAEEVGHAWWRAWTLGDLAEKGLVLERWEDAERWGRRALRAAHAIGERQLVVYGLALLARVATVSGRAERAGVLWGAIEMEAARGPVGQWEEERETYAAAIFAAPAKELERGRTAGRALSLDEAVEFALR